MESTYNRTQPYSTLGKLLLELGPSYQADASGEPACFFVACQQDQMITIDVSFILSFCF
jgi:hypothetical protein